MNWIHQHILTIVLFLPLAGAILLLFFPKGSDNAVRLWANIIGFAGFVVSLPLVFWFENGEGFLDSLHRRQLRPGH